MKPSPAPVLACAIAVACAIACSSTPQPISVVGEKKDIAQLVGVWQGDYQADGGGRSGRIEFRLGPAEETASGSVIIGGSAPDRGEGSHPPPQLFIRFVQLSQGWVSGRLDPYEDPECQCVIETLFQGRLSGDVMIGTYSSRGVYEPYLRTGKWSAKRVSSEVPRSETAP